MDVSKTLFKEVNFFKYNTSIRIKEKFSELEDLLIFINEYSNSYPSLEQNISLLFPLLNDETKLSSYYFVPYIQFVNAELKEILIVAFNNKDQILILNQKNLNSILLLLEYINFIFSNENKIIKKQLYFDKSHFIIENTSLISKKISSKSFGKKSVILKTNYKDDFWKQIIFSALKIIKNFFPDIINIIDNNLDIIIPVMSQDDDKSLSSSRNDIDNLIMVSKVTEKEMSEAIIHEVSHVILNKLNSIKPLSLNDDKFFYSPFRDDPRHALGLFHAAYSFLNVCIYLNQIYFNEKRLKIWAKYKLSDYLFNALLCSDILIKNKSVLTKMGLKTCYDIRKRILIIYDYHKFEILEDHYFEKKIHFNKWLDENQTKFDFTSLFNQIVSKLNIVQKFKEEIIFKKNIKKMKFNSFSKNISKIDFPVSIKDQKLINNELLQKELTSNDFKTVELINSANYKGFKTNYNVNYKSFNEYNKIFDNNSTLSKFLVITNFNKFISPDIWIDNLLLKNFWLGSVNSWFFMNKKDLHVLCHNDSVNNLHHVVKGKKTFFIAPPSTNLNEYSADKNFQEGFNAFNPFAEIKKAKNIGEFIVLNKNDSLYIPNGWWHSVFYDEDTIAISALDEPTHD